MQIRNFKKSDIPSLLNLIKFMVEYHLKIDRYYRPYAEYKNLEEEMDSWLKDKDTRVLIAEKSGKLIGYLQIAVESAPTYVSAKKIGIIYNLLVVEKYRRRGVAGQLMSEGLKWLEIKKVKNVELSVDARNKDAIQFWKKLGFFEYKFRMRLDL